MKKGLLALVLLLSLQTTNVNAQLLTEPDKRMHFSAGVVFGGISYGLLLEETENKQIALLGSIATAFAAGYIKETRDKKMGYTFDNRDLLATTLGGLSIGITFDIFGRNGKKKGRVFNIRF